MPATSLITSNHPMNVSIIRCNRLSTRPAISTLSHTRQASLPHPPISSEPRRTHVLRGSESIIRCNSPELFNNTVLIWVQHAAAHEAGRVPDPYPTHVAGFQQWKASGRSVDKGQAGYQILAPVTARVAVTEDGSSRRLSKGEKPKPGETAKSRMVGVRPAYVWDSLSRDPSGRWRAQCRPHLTAGHERLGPAHTGE